MWMRFLSSLMIFLLSFQLQANSPNTVTTWSTPPASDPAISHRDGTGITALITLVLSATSGGLLAYATKNNSPSLQTYSKAGLWLFSISTIGLGIAAAIFQAGYNKPIPRFSVTGDEWAPTKLSFDASDSSSLGANIESYEWKFGDGQTSVGSNATTEHIYSNPGTFTVSLKVTNSRKKSATKTLVINLNNGYPDVSMNAEILSEIPFAPLDMNLTATAFAQKPGAEIKSYDWDFGYGNFTQDLGNEVVHYYEEPGNYTVRVRVTDSYEVSTIVAENVNVPDGSPIPIIDIDYSNEYQSVPVSASFSKEKTEAIYPGANLTTLDWILPDGQTLTQDADDVLSLNETFNDPGNYTISLTAHDTTGRQKTLVKEMQIKARTPQIIVSQNATHKGYAPTVLTLDPNASYVNHPGYEITSYHWNCPALNLNATTYPPDGSISVPADLPGTYDCTVEATADKETQSSSYFFSVKALDGRPISNFTFKIENSKCYSNINFTSQATDPNGSIATYLWSLDGNIASSSTSWSKKFRRRTKSIKYNVTLTVIDNEGNKSAPYSLIISIPTITHAVENHNCPG